MFDFLREYWLWITTPLVLVLLGLLALWILAGGDGPTPFTYELF